MNALEKLGYEKEKGWDKDLYVKPSMLNDKKIDIITYSKSDGTFKKERWIDETHPYAMWIQKKELKAIMEILEGEDK